METPRMMFLNAAMVEIQGYCYDVRIQGGYSQCDAANTLKRFLTGQFVKFF